MTLKRSGPPQRRTPLKSTSVLKRAPFKPAVPSPRVPVDGPVKPSRRKPPPTDVPAALRLMVIERAEYRCDRCAMYLPGRQYSLQHRRARGAGGRADAHTSANLIILCGSATSPGCHSLAENEERAEAYRFGFAIRGEVARPEETPLFRHLSVWVIPGDGVWLPSEPPEDFAA